MSPWTPEDEERVNPTARWIFRGVWKILLLVFVLLLIGAIVQAVT